MFARPPNPASYGRYLRELKRTLERVYHEDAWVSSRVSWFLVGQTIFVTAYVYLPQTGKSGFLSYLIPSLGLAVCFITSIGILGAIFAIYSFCGRLDKEFRDLSEESQFRILGPLRTHLPGLFPPTLLPLVFVWAWVYILMDTFLWPTIAIIIWILFIIRLWWLSFPYPLFSR